MPSIFLKLSHIQGVKLGSDYKNVDHLLLKIYIHTPTRALNPISGERMNIGMRLEFTVITIICLNCQYVGSQCLPYLGLQIGHTKMTMQL